MADPVKQEEDVNHPVRWLPTAWGRIAEAAEWLQSRDHIKTNPADVIRTGTMQYVDEVLADKARSTQLAEKAG
jgi:hypothetical protein